MLNNDQRSWIKLSLAISAALRAELADIRRALTARGEHKHNPRWREQPRAPRGTPNGGQWVDGGGKPSGGPKGSGSRPPSPPPPPPPGPGHNQPPRVLRAPERLDMDWRNMSNSEYFETLSHLARHRRGQERVAALQAAIRTFEPTYQFNPILTTRRPGAYEQHLSEQLHVQRVRHYGPLGMDRAEWTQFRSEITNAMRRSRFPDARAYLRGSAVSGVSFGRGVLTETGPRDFDATIVSPSLFAAVQRSGMRLPSATRTWPLSARRLARLGMPGLRRSENGRPITYVVFSSASAMHARPGPAIPLSLD